MSLKIDIHDAQIVILRELLFSKSVKFSKLQQKTGMTSDHFSFHLKKLLTVGYIEKHKDGGYALSPTGKEYANKLDTDNNTIERQPKTAVILAIERLVGDRVEYLFQERLKQPYYGFWGFPTGKIRWGETITQTAQRELFEETGLAADLRVAGIYHELVYQEETGDQLEDKIFFVVHCTNTTGDLLVDFEGGHNMWMTREEALSQPKIFTSFDIEIDVIKSDQNAIIEKRVQYNKDLF